MVPSWTETLIEAGVKVVGRTRYCIHPSKETASIPVVGGTKSISRDKLHALGASLLLLDREENNQNMAQDIGIPILDTHVQSVKDVSGEIKKMAGVMQSKHLEDIASRWEVASLFKVKGDRGLQDLPGIQKWIRRPDQQKNFLYLIWKDPWMAVGEGTFIDSMMKQLGFSMNALADPSKTRSGHAKYPEVLLNDFDPKETCLLFSSEPYPFGQRLDFIKDLPFSSALIDGEAFSWFGIRSLKFLENEMTKIKI
jgi:iron complex transport system substrate-binding protein